MASSEYLATPLTVVCCDFTASLWRTALTASCKLRLGSICSFSDKVVSQQHDHELIRRVVYQPTVSPYKEVIKDSADSPPSCMRELNLALSKITFR